MQDRHIERLERTGIQVRINPTDRTKDVPAYEHIWAARIVYRIINPGRYLDGPDAGPIALDAENVLQTPQTIACWKCHRTWSRQRAARPCPGEPKDTTQ